MIKKIILNEEENSVLITGELIGVIIPPTTTLNTMRLETNDYKIIDWREVTNGYYPIRIQARTTDGSSIVNSFDRVKLSDDLVTFTCQSNTDVPTNIILLIESKQLVEV